MYMQKWTDKKTQADTLRMIMHFPQLSFKISIRGKSTKKNYNQLSKDSRTKLSIVLNT